MNGETYIRLTAPITPHSTQRLLQIIDGKYQSGMRKIHLLLSTPGGMVSHGISLYNFLKGIPMEVVTHNFGTVDSIGIIIFCAGSRRHSVPHARFFLHPVAMEINQQTRVDEHWLLEHSKSLKIDQENIARIISETTQRSKAEVLRDIGDRRTLHPEEAKSYGLVHDIQPDLMPLDADFAPIYESEAQQLSPLAGLASQIGAPPETLSPRPQDASSSIYDYCAVSGRIRMAAPGDALRPRARPGRGGGGTPAFPGAACAAAAGRAMVPRREEGGSP